jgi:hypothetical protein
MPILLDDEQSLIDLYACPFSINTATNWTQLPPNRRIIAVNAERSTHP